MYRNLKGIPAPREGELPRVPEKKFEESPARTSRGAETISFDVSNHVGKHEIHHRLGVVAADRGPAPPILIPPARIGFVSPVAPPNTAILPMRSCHRWLESCILSSRGRPRSGRRRRRG